MGVKLFLLIEIIPFVMIHLGFSWKAGDELGGGSIQFRRRTPGLVKGFFGDHSCLAPIILHHHADHWVDCSGEQNEG